MYQLYTVKQYIELSNLYTRYQTYHIWIWVPSLINPFQWLHIAEEVLVLLVTRINLAPLHAQVLCDVQPNLALEPLQEPLMLHATFHDSNLVIRIMVIQSQSRYCYWKHMISLLLQFRKSSSMCLLWCLAKNWTHISDFHTTAALRGFVILFYPITCY